MTKLAQQFQAAGYARQPKDLGMGWTFRAQKAYQVGKFRNVRPKPCPVFNHAVEALARALVINTGFEHVTHVDCNLSSLHHNYSPDILTPVAQIKPTGEVYINAHNGSAVAMLGYNAHAFYHWLTTLRIVDELSGSKVEVLTHDDGYVYAPIGIVLIAARDYVFNRDAVLATYKLRGALG